MKEIQKELLYQPQFKVKHVDSRLKTSKALNDNNNFRYELINFKDKIKINSKNGELYFGNNLEIDDYVILVKRLDVNTFEEVETTFILFVRDSDEVDKNNVLIKFEKDTPKKKLKIKKEKLKIKKEEFKIKKNELKKDILYKKEELKKDINNKKEELKKDTFSKILKKIFG